MQEETKLPKWAQQRLERERAKVAALEQQLETLQNMNAVMVERRDWFTITGPSFNDDEDYRSLFTLYRNGAHAVCSLGRGDVLFIGRSGVPRNEPK